MGIFDNILGKNSPGDDMAIEPCAGGYTIKNISAKAPKFDRACVFFSSPVADERDVVIGLAREYGFAKSLAPDALITTVHGAIPDIDEYLMTGEMPENLNAYLMARAMLNGLARGQAEMGKLAVNPFNYRGVKGVLVYKEI